MTVADLIRELQKLSPTAVVMQYDTDGTIRQTTVSEAGHYLVRLGVQAEKPDH